ncbi:hypothetical protein HanXRQr2_Chr10g0423601 [Helianthus annuus]|uniref:Uncharacterized protein n=1 Tax=Helianthus annuus TaxID=4232 RepID=A0A9K3N366_HELAN|nr:hypothetical protein HanXRQr2_Chr10g0423601 [Helianthus annuus]
MYFVYITKLDHCFVAALIPLHLRLPPPVYSSRIATWNCCRWFESPSFTVRHNAAGNYPLFKVLILIWFITYVL